MSRWRFAALCLGVSFLLATWGTWCLGVDCTKGCKLMQCWCLNSSPWGCFHTKGGTSTTNTICHLELDIWVYRVPNPYGLCELTPEDDEAIEIYQCQSSGEKCNEGSPTMASSCATCIPCEPPAYLPRTYCRDLRS